MLIWDEVLLQTIRDLAFGPPMSARAQALVHTAMFDAWAAYDDVAVGVMLGGSLRRPADERTTANKEEAMSFAAYRQLVDLFPARVEVFAETLIGLGYDPDDTSTDVSMPAGIGNVVAQALQAFRHDDGSNQLNGYAPLVDHPSVNGPLDPLEPGVGGLVDPSRWQPLIHHVGGREVVQRWINVNWPQVVPFSMPSGDFFAVEPPAPVKSGEYRRQAQELINLQAGLDDRQKVIAELWADGPTSSFPPGHWHEIAQWVSRRDGHTLDDDVKMFFLVANAVMDAGIAAWTTKLEYDYVRPITAVRYLKQGKKIVAWRGPGLGVGVMRGELWTPYQPTNFVTPPFAEYTSGHSAFSMAAATVLRRFTGSDALGLCITVAAGSSRVEPGLVPAEDLELCWPTFTYAAEEAGMSRLYGGIHFRKGNENSLTLGAQVGQQVWDVAQAHFDGTARTRVVSSN